MIPRGRAGVVSVTGLAHVAIAVPDAEPVARLLEAGFGARRGVEEWLDQGTLRVLFLHLGSLTLELLEPKPGHSVARFLERRGPGLHHICFDVADLDAALARAVQAGMVPIDATPRSGAHGSRVAFLHPRSTAGTLIELKQRRKGRTVAKRSGGVPAARRPVRTVTPAARRGRRRSS